jgi:hypothetical protein
MTDFFDYLEAKPPLLQSAQLLLWSSVQKSRHSFSYRIRGLYPVESLEQFHALETI